MKKILLMSYYLFLLSVLGLKIADTLLDSSVMIGKTNHIRTLMQEKKQLEESEYQLHLSLQQSHSLASIQASGLTSYEPIGTPILVDTTQAVASK